MPFAAFLMAIVPSLLARVLGALGMAVVTFTGMSLLMDQVIGVAQTFWGGLPAGMLALAGLAGVGQALSIIMGAILTRVAIWQIQRATRILGSNP